MMAEDRESVRDLKRDLLVIRVTDHVVVENGASHSRQLNAVACKGLRAALPSCSAFVLISSFAFFFAWGPCSASQVKRRGPEPVPSAGGL